MFWNVRSLYNKLDSIRDVVMKEQPDILNISETWLNTNILDQEIVIQGYTLVRYDRPPNSNNTIKKGGGICTFIKECLIFKDLTELSCLNDDIEISVIKFKLPFTPDIYVLNAYRPPSGNSDIFLNTLQQCITNIRENRDCDIFIGGDYNINYIKKNSPGMKKLSKFCKTNQFKQIINTITRPDSNTCIDLILTNSETIKESGALDINISDHLPIFFIRKKVKTLKKKITFKGRSYKNCTQEQFENFYNNYTWEDFMNNDVDTCWEIMFERILAAANNLCPIKDFKFSKDRPIWMSNDLISIMKERDIRLKDYLKAKTEDNKKNMRIARNRANISVKLARANYIKEQLHTFQNDPKKFWKKIAKIIPNSKSNSSNFSNIHDDNNDIISYDNLATHINCFFSDIGIKLDRTIPYVQSNRIIDKPPEILHQIHRFEIIGEEILLKEINKISIYKSSGITDMPTYILKMSFQILIQQLLVIINKSIFTGYFPHKWRKAIVVPIPKVNTPEEIGDLRPIALTPLPGKIIERFIHTQISNHLEELNILTQFQNGFRKEHSTIDTIFKYTTDLQNNKNNKTNTIALYIDFKKAFDTVNHELLLKKLHILGIQQIALKWITTYLTNRTQQTQIGNNLSVERPVNTGVPKGSILGPTFFLCYINDIVDVCQNSKIVLYANDTVIYKQIHDNQKFIDMHNFQQDIDWVIKWCQKK